ncbi:MAG: flagellar biosynthesis protein FlhA [Planctomycetes bacterium]|nr:flagellar biosynthesis protein FlhA [Planctomycetota bacterium]
MDARLRRALGLITRNTDLLLVAGFIGVLTAIVVPLPSSLMDLLLVGNITLAVVILMTTIYVKEPLEFSVFPTILLVTTVYRLALNVATTRLILTNAKDQGDLAAGHVVKAFGSFVAGDSPLIGMVIFSILIIVQFVVITKGATRVSEVAARFTLDGMPGKQMAIDADLNAGLINEREARARRKRITDEADFYGAMDGASKFVRGDAIAGIIITLINIVGGLSLGSLVYGLTIAEAIRIFTTLTVGDGLVSQIPALVISVAAGLIVTRTTSESHLGVDVVGQVVGRPRPLYLTAAFLLLLTLTPLPTIPLGLVGVGCLGLAWSLQWTERQKRRDEAAQAEAKPKGPEKVQALLHVDPMELEVGYALIRVVDASQGGDLLERITLLRRQLALDLGLVVPPIRIRDNMQLKPNDYVIKIRGVPVARGVAHADQYLAMDAGVATERIEGTETREPAFGLPAVWIAEPQRQRAEALGYTVVNASSVIATHLTEVIKGHADEILSREDVETLLSTLKETAPVLVNEVVPKVVEPGELKKVLGGLLRERVPVKSLETIVQTLAEFAPRTKDTEVLVEYCRNALGRAICQLHAEEDGRIYCITLDPRMEEMIRGATEHTDRGSYLALAPEVVQRVVERVSRALETLVSAGHQAVILCAPQVRLQVRRMMERAVPNVAVLSYNEVVRGIQVESMAVAALEELAAAPATAGAARGR